MAEMNQSNGRPRRRKGDSVTLHDVAQKAGVHPMTVSNALKGTGRMTEMTRETIRRVALELNYKPNLSARALVTGRTGSVAVMTGPMSEHFYARLLHLLEAELANNEIQLVWTRTRHPEQELSFLLQSGAVDGVIVIDAVDALERITSANSAPLPCVYAGVHYSERVTQMGVDNIAIDLSGAVRDAIQALFASGSRRVTYLVFDNVMARPEEVRHRIYKEEMAKAGRPPEVINLNIKTDSDTSHRHLVRERFIEYIQQHGAPDGVLCQNDEIAIAAYRALLDLGLRVPGDVRLVGCDGLADMEYFDPPLASIEQPAQAMCALAWQFLQRRLREPTLPPQHATLSAQLRMRPSLLTPS